MGSIHENSPNKSRALLIKLIADCRFITCTREDCPIWEQRYNLSIEKIHNFAVRLSTEQLKNVLAQYNCCYKKRLADLEKW